MDYQGKERRGDQCDMHKENSDLLGKNALQLAGIQSGIIFGRWIGGIALVISMAVIGGVLNDIKVTLAEIRSDVKHLAPVNVRLDRLEKVQDTHDNRLRRLEQGTK